MRQPPSTGGLDTAIQLVAARLLVFGILSYSVVWAGRMYRSQAHNQVVNKHRSDALRTFETFAEATSDAATKNVILVQATQCIFSHRPSGFGQQDNDVAPSSHMLELTRGMIGPETPG